jgi:4-alpha-glucanotransferase
MKLNRSCGVLLHITSLPGEYGIGTLGDEAYRFIDLLSENGVSYWQILPIGPVSNSMRHSPYSSLSSFAGNELFINIGKVKEKKWFIDDAIITPNISDDSFVDFNNAENFTASFIKLAQENFMKHSHSKEPDELKEFNKFCIEHGDAWLNDYALYRALAAKFDSFNWLEWDRDIALRNEESITKITDELKDQLEFFKFAQFLFHSQWDEMKEYASKKRIKIIGDIPIYMSMDSADSWSNQNILRIDYENMTPEFVAGVPPDYFSETGQLWGNPLYIWHNSQKQLNEETYQWWRKRIDHTLKLMDIVRIDHFRGFESFWSVKYGEKTAIDGEWLKGPGRNFFDRLKKDLGDLPIIAEDLGIITPEVKKLREELSLPGMKILLFAFDHNNKNEYLTHNITDKESIVYTGTHDNNTANGWFYDPAMSADDRKYILEYLGMKDWSDFHLRLIREAMATMADLVIIPVQDILGYGEKFRMNTPGTIENNWQWKLTKNALNETDMAYIKRMAHIFSRIPESPEDNEDGNTLIIE